MTRRLAATAALAACASLAVPAVAATPVKVTSKGVGKVRVGAKHSTLKAKGLVGKQIPGCELAGPRERAAKLRNGARGFVNLTRGKPRRVRNVMVSGRAAAKGVGIGDRRKDIEAAFPHAKFDSSTAGTFRLVLARVPERDGGRFELAISTETKRITVIGVPFISFCE
jgi:hypothetical protein